MDQALLDRLHQLRRAALHALDPKLLVKRHAEANYKTSRMNLIKDYGLDTLPPVIREGRSSLTLRNALGGMWVSYVELINDAFDEHIDQLIQEDHLRVGPLPGYFHPDVISRCQADVLSGEYASAILKAFRYIEVRVRQRAELTDAEVGLSLMSSAMGKSGRLRFSTHPSEQEGYHQLFRAAISVLKNPLSHKEVEHLDYGRTLERLAFASMLLKDLDEADVLQTQQT
jgi:uncharacterized protein (TIGR02391 family)